MEVAEAGGGIGVVGGEEDDGVAEGVLMGVGFDGGVGLAGEPVAGGVGGELVVEKLLLGVADIGGEEDVMGVGLQEDGAMAVGMAGGMDEGEVFGWGEPGGVLEGADGLVEGYEVGMEPVWVESWEGAEWVVPFWPGHIDRRGWKVIEAVGVVEVEVGEDDGGD